MSCQSTVIREGHHRFEEHLPIDADDGFSDGRSIKSKCYRIPQRRTRHCQSLNRAACQLDRIDVVSRTRFFNGAIIATIKMAVQADPISQLVPTNWKVRLRPM